VRTARDALRLIRKERQARQLEETAETLYAAFPEQEGALRAWLARHALKALAFHADRERIALVLRWFLDNPRSGLYLRQLDIPGIDTKFVEQRKGLLDELLAALAGAGGMAGEAAGDSASTAGAGGAAAELDSAKGASAAAATAGATFEERHGLRAETPGVRFRLLDRAAYIGGLSDVQTPADQFAALALAGVRTVFIAENKVNGLCFPDFPGGMAVFGLGFGVDRLKAARWLTSLEVFYWGDIDTHGFAILNQARAFLPHARSLFMDEETLLRHRALWSSEPKPFAGELTRLTPQEARCYAALRQDTYGAGVRMEQERIPFGEVARAVRALAHGQPALLTLKP